MLSNEEKQMIIGLFPFFKENPTIIDVGSNKGHFTDVVLDEFGIDCQVYLLEPIELLLNYTKVKYEYKNNITYNDLVAWSEDDKRIDFNYFDNYNNELSSVYDAGDEWKDLPKKVKSVSSIRIDTYCERNKIDYVDFVKIDCEGADYEVLLGCEDLLKNNKVGFIQIEYGSHYKRAGAFFRNAIHFADLYGYKCYLFDGNYWEVKKESFVEDFRFENFIITKEEIHNYSVGGWNTQFILNTAELEKMDMVLEIGAFEGLTTKYICENMLNEGGRVVVVDPLLEYYYDGDNGAHPYFRGQYQRFIRNTRGLPIELHRGMAEDELPKLNELRFDLVYVDGNHWHPHPYNDGCWAFAITKIGGYILFDDYTWNESSKMSIDKFLDEFNGSYEVVIKDYQVLIKKIANRYNELTYEWYK